MERKKLKVAVAQDAPPYPPSKNESTEFACKLVEEAGKNKARIIVLPESFIPAYPNWAIEAKPPIDWNNKCSKLIEESIEIPSPELDQICDTAKTLGSVVCLGVSERDKNFKNSIYNSIVFIDSSGSLLGKHRKLTPVYREKVFWTSGVPKDLNSVFETSFGKIGGLVCAEHLNPLLKSAMIIQREEIHVACYPGWGGLPKHVMDTSIRQYAIEAQCYVLASSQYISGMPENSQDSEANWNFYGGSAIIDPMGNYVVGPSYSKKEILYADIDLSSILDRKVWIDVTGKDARWDVIPFLLEKSNQIYSE
jgi:predicted amidohydrolase